MQQLSATHFLLPPPRLCKSPTRHSPSITHNQAAPSSRVSSVQDDPHNYFNKLQFHWKMLRNHHDIDLYWFFQDDPASLTTNSVIITELLLLLLVELDIPTPPGVKWTGHSLRRGGTSSAHAIDVSIAVIMAWGFMEVSRLSAPHRRLCVDVFRRSLLRPPAYALQSSSSATRSSSSVNCRELVDRPERRFGSVARARCLESSISSGTTSRRPYQKLHRQF